jgi:hypothetical protein
LWKFAASTRLGFAVRQGLHVLLRRIGQKGITSAFLLRFWAQLPPLFCGLTERERENKQTKREKEREIERQRVTITGNTTHKRK